MPDLQNSVVFQQWPITEGAIRFELRTDRPLLSDEYVEIGKVMGELERLAEMLSSGGSDGKDATP